MVSNQRANLASAASSVEGVTCPLEPELTLVLQTLSSDSLRNDFPFPAHRPSWCQQRGINIVKIIHADERAGFFVFFSSFEKESVRM